MNKYSTEYSLSNHDILDLLDGDTRVITYPQLAKYKSLDQLLYPYNSAIILYLWKPRYGHWVSVIRNGDKIEFMDPYGLYPDEPLLKLPMKQRIALNEETPYLSHLFINSPHKITYNNYKFQKSSPMVSTCGRWAVLRVLFKDLSLKQFKKIFYRKNADKIISYITGSSLE